MRRTGRIGIGVMVLAFSLAIVASLWLALEVRTQALVDLIPYVLLAFVLIFGLMLFGLRLWLARSVEVASESDVEQQRRILAGLVLDVPTSFEVLSRAVSVDEALMEGVLRELVRLNLFNGYIDWRGQRLCAMLPQDVEALHTCRVCGMGLEQASRPAVCPQCATVYLQAQA